MNNDSSAPRAPDERPVGLFDSFITRSWYSPAARAIWSDVGTLGCWLEVEVALATVQAELGLIPAEAPAPIAAAARPERFDLARLAADSAFMGHPFVPTLRQLEELCGEPWAGYLHLGATTQNIFDTAASLQMQRTHGLVDTALAAAAGSLANLAVAHRHTVQAGRTHGQHALPITFGFKVAGWLEELNRDRERLRERAAHSFLACMGGAVGTYAALAPQGREVERRLAARLGLQPAGLASRSSFDRMADYVTALGLLAGTAQRLAADVYFLQRNEVGEVEESFHHGKIGSSTMAQKRNPVLAAMIVTMCRLLRSRVTLVLEAMPRADEADTTTSSVSEMTLPDVGLLAVAIAEGLAKLVQGLRVSPERMAQNVALTRGLICAEAAMMVLAPVIGRHQAHELLYDAAQRAWDSGRPLAEELAVQTLVVKHRLGEAVVAALRPENYTGESAALAAEAAARTRFAQHLGSSPPPSAR